MSGRANALTALLPRLVTRRSAIRITRRVMTSVGSVRGIRLQWISVRERFLAWEPGRRFAFSSDAMSLPLARELIEEDIRFEPIDRAAPG